MKIRIPAEQISKVIAMLEMVQNNNEENNIASGLILNSKLNDFERYSDKY